jgi:hypothetical protein
LTTAAACVDALALSGGAADGGSVTYLMHATAALAHRVHGPDGENRRVSRDGVYVPGQASASVLVAATHKSNHGGHRHLESLFTRGLHRPLEQCAVSERLSRGIYAFHIRRRRVA